MQEFCIESSNRTELSWTHERGSVQAPAARSQQRISVDLKETRFNLLLVYQLLLQTDSRWISPLKRRHPAARLWLNQQGEAVVGVHQLPPPSVLSTATSGTFPLI